MSTDVLIIGSGIAGLRLALSLAPKNKVTIITKRKLRHSNTRWAQGGIAAAWEDDDSWKAHVEDTLTAGAGMCRREVVEFVARQAKQRVEELISFGVEFDRLDPESERYSLHREGGHSARRILHSKDLTGAEIMRALIKKVRNTKNIQIYEDWMAVDIITTTWLTRRKSSLPSYPNRAIGAYALNWRYSCLSIENSCSLYGWSWKSISLYLKP